MIGGSRGGGVGSLLYTIFGGGVGGAGLMISFTITSGSFGGGFGNLSYRLKVKTENSFQEAFGLLHVFI